MYAAMMVSRRRARLRRSWTSFTKGLLGRLFSSLRNCRIGLRTLLTSNSIIKQHRRLLHGLAKHAQPGTGCIAPVLKGRSGAHSGSRATKLRPEGAGGFSPGKCVDLRGLQARAFAPFIRREASASLALLRNAHCRNALQC